MSNNLIRTWKKPTVTGKSNRSLSLEQAAAGVLAHRQPQASSDSAIVICDVSDSMDAHDAQGGMRRIDALRRILRNLAKNHEMKIVAFSNRAAISSPRLPEPSGGTALHRALEFAAPMCHQKSTVILISDGEPDSEPAAFAAADRFPAKINVFYVGPKGGWGQRFLKELARRTAGQYAPTNLSQPEQLEAAAKRLLLNCGRDTL